MLLYYNLIQQPGELKLSMENLSPVHKACLVFQSRGRFRIHTLGHIEKQEVWLKLLWDLGQAAQLQYFPKTSQLC